MNPALSDPPGLHEAELEGSAGVVGGLQGYLWGCRGTCRIIELCTRLQGVPAGSQGHVQGCRGNLWDYRVMWRVAGVTCGVAGVHQHHHTWRVAAL